jgi:hypothetical protein
MMLSCIRLERQGNIEEHPFYFGEILAILAERDPQAAENIWRKVEKIIPDRRHWIAASTLENLVLRFQHNG